MPDHFDKLDFELEAAIVICRQGRNIPAEEAGSYIGGLMIMNDMSARTLQMEEMKLNLGPAKGKDFSTATGPWLVTLDELAAFETAPKENHRGQNWNLTMTCRVNGQQVSQGNLGDMDWTFAEIIERASYGTDLLPGDVIGSGDLGTPWPLSRLGRLAAASARIAHRLEELELAALRSAPLLGLVAARGDDHRAHLRSGEVLERVWLAATALGLGVQPASAAIEVPETRAELVQVFGLPAGLVAQELVRIGWPAGPRGFRTPRRPVEEVARG